MNKFEDSKSPHWDKTESFSPERSGSHTATSSGSLGDIIRYFLKRLKPTSKSRWPWYLTMPPCRMFETWQVTFFTSLCGALARLAEADGPATPAKLKEVDLLFEKEFHFPAHQRLSLLAGFHDLRKSETAFEVFIQEYYHVFAIKPFLLQNFISLLVEFAYSDGTYSKAKDDLIQSALRIFQFTHEDYHSILSRSTSSARTRSMASRSASSSSDWEKHNSSWRTQSSDLADTEELPLSRCYELLGLKPEDSTSEVRKRFRELVFKFHPDRMLAQEQGSELKEFNESHFRRLQAAYQNILQSRKAQTEPKE